MLSSLRHRLLGLRLFWIAMLLLGTVFKPALVVACESHEATHFAATGHGHDDDAHESGPPADESAVEGTVEPLLSLLHQGHCCVHGAAIVEVLVTPRPVLMATAPEVAAAARLFTSRRTPVLRPPIHA